MGQIKTGRILTNATGGENANHGLVISVARGEHGGETSNLLLATADGARFFELPAHAHGFKRAFAVDFFLQPTQRTIHRLAFFQFNLCQIKSHPLGDSESGRTRPDWFKGVEGSGYFCLPLVSIGKNSRSGGFSPVLPSKAACAHVRIGASSGMALPPQSVTLTAEQIADLNTKLATLRHDINNNLLLIMASAELVRYKPETAEQMMGTLLDQPPKITEKMSQFSAEFEQLLGITKP